MANEREEVLKKLLIANDFKEESYKEISFQELIILKNSAKNMQAQNLEENAKLFMEKKEQFFVHLILKAIPQMESLFCLFHKATNLPYVVCDEESLNDQVYVFSNEKFALAEAAKQNKENNLPLFAVKMENKQFLNFFTNLFCQGVNELVMDKNMNSMSFELTKLVKKPDYSELPVEKRPVMNPELLLTATYFAQMKALPEEKRNAEEEKDLEEEMLVNLTRGKIVIPVIMPELKEGEVPDVKDIRIPYLKLPNGDVYQAICSDLSEFMRFNKENKFRNMVVSGAALKQMVAKGEIKGMMLNPATVKIAIPKAKL